MKRLGRLSILGLALCLPLTAHADPKDDARRHFAAGLKAAQDGDYAIALQRFLAAQEAYPHPATLYNIARSYMDVGDLENARKYFLLYSEAAPDKASDIDPMLAAIELRMGAPTVDPTAPTPGTVAVDGAAPGPTQLVVTGPTDAELARLEELAEEFDTLLDAIKERRAEDEARVAAAEASTPQTRPAGAPPADGEDPVPTDASASLLEGAYDRIVVTASRVGQDPLDSPSTLTVLTASDIKMSGAQQLPDLLRRVVGVDVMQLSAGHDDVSIRGFNRKAANKVLVLIDGRSTYTDFVGVTFWSSLPISLEDIERIEVIRGPGSAVYGANAVTGVINIITKTPGEREERVAAIDYGFPDISRGAVFVNGASGDTRYRLSAGFQRHGRWSKEAELYDADGGLKEGVAVVPFFEDQDTARDVVRANGRIDQTFGSQGYASLSAGLTQGIYEFYNIGALPNFGLDMDSQYVRADLSWGAAHLRAFWNSDVGTTGPWLEEFGQNQSLNAPLDNDAIDVELEGPLSFRTGPVQHTLNLGVSYRYKRIAFGDYLRNTPRVEHHQAAFINEQISVGKLGVVASLRVDNHPLIAVNETLSPRGSVLYRLFEKTSLRATFGTAFRAPNALESYMDFNLPNPAADGVFINDVGDQTTLSPERISTYEIGVHDASSFLHTADVVVYMNRVRDLINLSPVDPNIQFLDPQANGFEFGQTGWTNLPEAYVGTGIEAELELYPTDGLDVYGNINLAQITQDGVRDRSLSGVKLNLGTMYRAPFRMDVTADLHYVGPQTWNLRNFDEFGQIIFTPEDIPARTLMTTRLAGRPFVDERLELAATAWNLLSLLDNTGFREHPEGQFVRGRLFGSLSYKF